MSSLGSVPVASSAVNDHSSFSASAAALASSSSNPAAVVVRIKMFGILKTSKSRAVLIISPKFGLVHGAD